jgi:hypothetical protein
VDRPGFDALTHLRGTAPSRRGLVAVLSGLLTSPWQSGALVGAKKKPKTISLCLNGKTIRVPKEKKKKLLKRGATRGACSSCPPCGEGAVCTGFDHVCCPSERVTTHDLGTAHPITSCCPEGFRGDVAGNPGCCEGQNSGVCPNIHRAR